MRDHIMMLMMSCGILVTCSAIIHGVSGTLIETRTMAVLFIGSMLIGHALVWAILNGGRR